MQVKEFLISSVILLVLDLIWLGVYMIGHFSKLVERIQNGTPLKARVIFVILAYVFLSVGFYYFIIRDDSKTWIDAFLLGLVVYGVYESTNFAIFKDWTLSTYILDTLWGGVLFSISFVLYKLIIKPKK